MVKIGDRVRFLNSVGGGIVRKFQSKDIVLVEEEDGFETPVLARECVVVETISSETNLPEIKKQASSAPAPIIIREEPEEDDDYDYDGDETPEGEALTVLLAFLPQDSRQMQSTDYDAYLINDSNYFLHYNIATLADGQAIARNNGIIEPNTKFNFGTLNKDSLNDWERISVQMLAFKKKKYEPKSPVNVELKLNPVKFYKLHSFTENDYFKQDAMVLEVVTGDMPASALNFDPQQLKDALGQKKEDVRRRTRIEKNDVLEVDLHIDELLDTTAGMTNADMLQYQLDKFNQVLEENKNRKGHKIVFIHGKGEGVLRNEIMKQLKSKYSGYYVQDASFREYGFGATMVTIR
ncbi:MAG: DUF2027 domain-containing protein [Paludibacteraceae bacterium]|nr:DUF2027 domain-containing protein [Paludibacteraceae bacterium]